MAETATGIVNDLLTTYGLTYAPEVVNRWVGLLSDDPDNIVIIEEEIRKSREFAERFPGIQARLDAGYNAISVDEYLELEDTYRTIVRTAGLPEEFYDSPDEVAELIANDVSPTEFETRVVDGFIAAQDAPQEVRDMLSEFYGITDTDGALAAFFLDPDKALPAIQKQFESAVIGARAMQTGTKIDASSAERLQSLGVTEDEAQAGFTDIGASRGLTTSNLGQDRNFSLSEVMRAQFEGDTEIINAIRRQQEQRRSRFSGESGGAITQRGIAGLGSTSSSSGSIT